MTRAAYFLGNSYLGEGPPLPEGADSFAYTCSTCGEIWARVIVPGKPFLFINRPCEKHEAQGVQDWADRHRQGLFQHAFSQQHVGIGAWPLLPKFFPPSVLRREFLLMYEHWRNRNETLPE